MVARMFFYILLPLFASRAAEVRVMSYNIRTASTWARTHGGDGAHRRTWEVRRNGVINAIRTSKSQVVGTQEGLSGQLDDLIKQLPGWSRFGEGREGGESTGDENEFAAILFNGLDLKRVAGGTFWLSETPDQPASTSWDTSLPRVASWAVFSCLHDHGKHFGVINSHFDHSSEEARANSALLVRRFVSTVESHTHGGPVFITGDFNAAKNERWWELFTADAAVLANPDSEIMRGLDYDGDFGLPLRDAWDEAEKRSCGACGQSTYHAWQGSYAPNHMWVKPYKGKDSRSIALIGKQHVDGIMVSNRSANVHIVQAKMITDDKRIHYLGGPHASDHYPVFAHATWVTQDAVADTDVGSEDSEL